MRVVVTGAAGFLGWHLVEALTRRGDHVEAWVHRTRAPDWPGAVKSVPIDIMDQQAVAAALDRAAPEVVVHLAAQSLPGRSWVDPLGTYRSNVIGMISLLEATRSLKAAPRVLVAGSSAEYADLQDGRPIREDGPTEANSPYAASKIAADQLAQLCVRRYQLDLVRFRPFFIVGPRKTGDVCSDLARRVVAIERGQEQELRVGRLDVVRDIIDIRDGVAALLCLIGAGTAGEVYNICSGNGVVLSAVAEAYRRLATVPFNVVRDPALDRPLEQAIRIGDSTKLRALGWAPKHDLEETLRSILEYWRRAES